MVTAILFTCKVLWDGLGAPEILTSAAGKKLVKNKMKIFDFVKINILPLTFTLVHYNTSVFHKTAP